MEMIIFWCLLLSWPHPTFHDVLTVSPLLDFPGWDQISPVCLVTVTFLIYEISFCIYCEQLLKSWKLYLSFILKLITPQPSHH